MPDTKYPAQPKNLIGDDMIAMPETAAYYFRHHVWQKRDGRLFRQTVFEERWQVIHYIRSLQAK
jgi:hypothetical protein